MILKIFIIGRGGTPYYSKSFCSQIEIDEGILSGFLAAFSDFAQEINGGEVRALIFRNFNFIYSYSVEFNLIFIIVIDKIGLEEEVKTKVDLMKNEFIKRYRKHLENWPGDINLFKAFDDFVDENVFIPPRILITGEEGVGKTTILNLLPGDLIIELDDELNQILKKTVSIKILDNVNEFILQEIDLNDLVNNSSIYKNLLNAIDLVLVMTNSGASNLGRTKDLISKLKSKIQNTEIFLIANFQDLEDVAFNPQQIEDSFKIRTFGLSAIEEGAKQKIITILSELLENFIITKEKKGKFETIELMSERNESEEVTSVSIDFLAIWDKINDAKLLEKQGDHIAAAEKFANAANQFKKLCSDSLNLEEGNEINAIYYLCKAWESMEIAEETKEPNKYAESYDLFNRASELFTETKYKYLALGNAAFCRALELSSKFDQFSDKAKKAEYYPEIKMMLRNAANSYRRGGFESEADWALATSTYFDATWYIISADGELNLDEKKRLLDIGSKMLESAAELFGKAGYKDKEMEVKDHLGQVQKEEKIIMSALNTISEPSISKETISLLKAPISLKPSISPKEASETKKKYKLVYKDLIQEYSKIQKRECRIGIAQIGISSTGDLLSEYYEEKLSGLLGLRDDKVDSVEEKVKQMVNTAYNNKVNILIFPEMSIDLNYGKILETLSDLAKSNNMYIIPGSYHSLENKRNISIVIGPEGILWEQEKHIPATIHFKEKKFEENINIGTFPRKTIICNTEYGRIAIVICRDFLDMDLRVELKNFEPPIDLIINPAYTPVTADFKAAHFDARRSIYAYCFFVNIAEYGESLIYTPEKERVERIVPPREEKLIFKDLDLFKLRSERKKWEVEQKKNRRFIQSTR